MIYDLKVQYSEEAERMIIWNQQTKGVQMITGDEAKQLYDIFSKKQDEKENFKTLLLAFIDESFGTSKGAVNNEKRNDKNVDEREQQSDNGSRENRTEDSGEKSGDTFSRWNLGICWHCGSRLSSYDEMRRNLGFSCRDDGSD